MKTFNDIKLDDFVYILSIAGLESKINQFKVVGAMEETDKQGNTHLVLTFDNGVIYSVDESIRQTNVDVFEGIYTELETALAKLDSIYKDSVDWLNHLFSEYTKKVETLKNEVIKWQKIQMKK